MSTQTPLSKDDPIMIAWSHYKITDSYSNTRKWALLEEHVDGSLWAAFLAGWGASRREVNEQRTALTGPASEPTDNTLEELRRDKERLNAIVGSLRHWRKPVRYVLDKAATLIEQQAREIEGLKADMDIDICRLQLPDGSVPTDTVACARAWHKEANRFWKERDKLDKEIGELKQDNHDAWGYLEMVADTLSNLGCCHDKKTHKATPPMMYPEWIYCVVKSHTDAIKTQLCTVTAERDTLREQLKAKV